AVSRTVLSSICPAQCFQLFHPSGGVAARLSWAAAEDPIQERTAIRINRPVNFSGLWFENQHVSKRAENRQLGVKKCDFGTRYVYCINSGMSTSVRGSDWHP